MILCMEIEASCHMSCIIKYLFFVVVAVYIHSIVT